jgi:hypothetical protein
MASFDELRQRASKADAEAQFNLAMRYAGGVEIEKSDIEVIFLFCFCSHFLIVSFISVVAPSRRFVG